VGLSQGLDDNLLRRICYGDAHWSERSGLIDEILQVPAVRGHGVAHCTSACASTLRT